MSRGGLRRWGRVAVIAGIVFLGISAVPDVRMSGLVIPCPTASGLVVQSFLVGRAAASPCPGQEWARSYGTSAASEYAIAARQTTDGGYIVSLQVFGGPGLTVLLKLDPTGTIQWQKSYGNSYPEPHSLVVLPDGGYAFVNRNGQGDARLVRLDATGAIVWEKVYGGPGGDNLVSIATTTDGGFIVGGATDSWGAGSLDFWILKLDALGAVQWERVAGTPAYEFLRAIVQTSDGGYAAVGETDDSYGWALKLDSQGNVVSSLRMAGKGSIAILWTVVAMPDGGFVAGGSGSVLVRFAASGAVVWKKTYGGAATYGIARTSDGGFVATGLVKLSVYNVDAFVLRIDGNGNPIWMKTYGGLEPKFSPLADLGRDVQQTADGGFIIAGETAAFSMGGGDAWVLKLAPDGSVVPSCPSGIGASRSVSASNSKNTVGDLAITTGPTSAAVGTGSSTVADYTALTLTQCSA